MRRVVTAALFCLAALTGTATAGVVPGLQGEYFNNMVLSGVPALTRIDSTVNFNWGTGSPGAGISVDQFSVRWTGQVRIPANGAYTFYTQSDDGVRLWVDCNGNGSFQPGEQLVNNWTNHSSTENSGSCAGLSAGDWVDLRMEYYENGGNTVAQLSWSGPGIAKQIIPGYDGTRGLGYDDTTPPTIASVTASCGLADRVAVVFSEAVDPATATAIANYALNHGASVTGATLAPDGRTVLLQTSMLSATGSYQLTVNNVRDLAVPPNSIAANTRVNFSYPGGGLRNGLTGTYFGQGGVSGAFFTGSTVTQVDAVVDFNWGGGSPAAGIGADNFSVRWTGYVQASVAGVYTFRTQSDDGIRLWVGGTQVINNWTDHGPTYNTGAVTLAAGQYYAVTLEYYERGGGALARLQWQKPGDAGFSTLPAGNLFHCGTPPVAPGGFNAFETSTLPGSITGVIRTKVAAQAFDLAVVALNLAKTGVETGFEGDVKIELLDASDNSGVLDANGCRPSWTPLPVFVPPTLTFSAADQGRKNVSLTENNAWREVRIRMSYPLTGAPSAVGCSTDNFAIRPASFSGFVIQHADWETPGLLDMNNLSLALRINAPPDPPPINLTNAHKAGRPFRIAATAINDLSATTSNYSGAPSAALSSCIGTPACLTLVSDCACTPGTGTLLLSGNAVAGEYVTTSATYDNTGAFTAQLQDTVFADVDVGDTPADCAGRYICSASVNVGRFVPDHFTMTSGAISPACTSGPIQLTFMNQEFPVFSANIEARTYVTESVTSNYHSPDFGISQLASVDWQAENADNGTGLSARLSVPQPAVIWNAGTYSLSAIGAQFRRAVPDDPDGPFDQLQIGVSVTDPDDVKLNALDMNPSTAGVCVPPNCTALAVGAATSVRFGRLRIQNAHGSELRALPLTVHSEFWNGSGFAVNGSDGCTALAAGEFSLLNWQANLNAGETTLAGGGPWTALGGLFTGPGLTAPGTGNQGSVDVTVDLAARPWLRGRWNDAADTDADANTMHDDDPVARATFGIFRDRLIYRREITR